MRLYPAEVEEDAQKASKRGTGEKKVRLYPAEVEEDAQKASKRGIEEK